MLSVKLSDLKTTEAVLASQLEDAEFRAEWERTAVARGVARAMVAYRARHELSQRALAEKLGMSQPQVARLEGGDKSPTIETLIRLSRRLGVEVALDIHPPAAEPRLVTKRARDADAMGADQPTGSGVVLAVAS